MVVYLRVRLKRLAVRRAALIRVAKLLLAAVEERQSELSIELVGERRMRRLNREYRKKDGTTDVLAFPMRDVFGRHTTRLDRLAVPRGTKGRPFRAILGDVVISVPTALRQAKAASRSPDDELISLLVHGVLHLCGYDHERSKKEATLMHRRERSILRTICPVPRLVSDYAEKKRSR